MFTKYQIAQQYFPDLEDRAARKKLQRWIEQVNGLMPALEQTGYCKRQQWFSQRQKELIFEYLGEP